MGSRGRNGRPIIERFWEKVDKISSPKDCWNWCGSVNIDNAGTFWYKGRLCLAPRVCWEITNGIIPKGVCVQHTCNRKICCNPDHLYLGPSKGKPTPILEETFWTRVTRLSPDECWNWTGNLDKDGYGRHHFPENVCRAHRRAWILTNGPIPTGMQVCHKCDNRKCCNPDHLWLGTNNENMADMVAKGRAQSGEARYNSALSDSQAIDILIRYIANPVKGTQAALAREYNVSTRVINALVRGKTRKALHDELENY